MPVSKELFLEHGWKLPDGFRDKSLSNPTNFTLAEWQQSVRNDRDPREIKQALRQAWDRSDSLAGLKASLQSNGFALARGDRRGYVVVDYFGEVYSLTRYAGLKVKDIKARIGGPDTLPSISEIKDEIRQNITPSLKRMRGESFERHAEVVQYLKDEAKEIARRHQAQRKALLQKQSSRWGNEKGYTAIAL